MGIPRAQKKQEVWTFPEVFSAQFAQQMMGKWRAHLNTARLVVEVGSGRGQFLAEYARVAKPNVGFVGIERKSVRVWSAVQLCRAYGVSARIRFIIGDAQQIDQWFAPEEVDEIWIQFPDPVPSSGKWHRRLTALPFLEKYYRILKTDGTLHIKTDEDWFLDFTIVSIEQSPFHLVEIRRDLHRVRPSEGPLSLWTEYERQHVQHGREIYYVQARKP